MPNILPNVNPLSYLGVRAETPANCVVQKIPPSSNDKPEVGSFVVDEVARIGYQLVGYVNGVPDWQPIGGGGAAIQTINTNAPIAGNYTLAGTANQITVAQSAGTSTFSIPTAFIAPGSIASTTSITAGTTLTATLGNITATNGNLVLSAPGNKLVIAAAGPTTDSVGTTGPMVAGAVTITSSAITASSKIIFSRRTLGTAMGNVSITAQAGGSATLTSDEGTETSTFDYLIIN